MDGVTLRSIKLKEYNDIPVYYCKGCLSLKIKGVYGTDIDYCDDCGSTVIDKAHIEEWETLYKERYNINYLNKNKDNGREKSKTYL